jgi:hypothetical protein
VTDAPSSAVTCSSLGRAVTSSTRCSGHSSSTPNESGVDGSNIASQTRVTPTSVRVRRLSGMWNSLLAEETVTARTQSYKYMTAKKISARVNSLLQRQVVHGGTLLIGGGAVRSVRPSPEASLANGERPSVAHPGTQTSRGHNN